MNLEIDQEQSDQSRRCEGATMAKHNCWDHACTRETNETTHDPLPALAESCLSKISSLCTDAPGRMDAAPVYPTEASTAARAGCTYVQLFELAKQRYGHGAMLDAYTQGLFDGIESTAQRVGVALTQ